MMDKTQNSAPPSKTGPSYSNRQHPKNPSVKPAPAIQASRRSSSDRRDASRLSASHKPPPSSAGRQGITTTSTAASAKSPQSVSSRPSSRPNPEVLTSARISANRNTDGENFASTEPPARMTSIRLLEDPSLPGSRSQMSEGEADALCKELCKRIWKDNMAAVFDKVTEADRRGHVDDRLYHQLLDFFYCFLPMIIKAPPSDPIVVRSTDLENYRKILNIFGDGRDIRGPSGTNNPHRWFSRPIDHRSFTSRMEHGIKEFTAAMLGRKGRGDKVAVKEDKGSNLRVLGR
ncbi:hypothetical protein NA56DRAFT_710043 [Hyaloscypha hepaticicola]|uniref:Uncharacterized protein n=1 Tax=Hyaloscypha hepaticicola TaxID=2082293 RepID=A0A2J6PNB3_9HELO|nr:hypothetical protein NA56DRAFT_710043 [Hyaloscypha hepaticicola]